MIERPFKSFPKPLPKEKKSKLQSWNEMKKRSIQKKINSWSVQSEKEYDFYVKCVWLQRPKFCFECQCVLNAGMPSDKNYLKNVKFFSHHIYPKAQYPHLKYEPLNIMLLCRQHHSEVESVISLPKMKCYKEILEIKKLLLG